MGEVSWIVAVVTVVSEAVADTSRAAFAESALLSPAELSAVGDPP
jgi:hypothetical protein